jgi:hypothetical protein
MAGIEQEMNGVRRIRHQRIDIGLVLHHRSHVMVVDKRTPFTKRRLATSLMRTAELGPLPGRSTGRRDSGFAISPWMALLVSANTSTLDPIALSKSRCGRRQCSSAAASRRKSSGRIQPDTQARLERRQRRPQRLRLARKLVTELHAGNPACFASDRQV